MVYRWVPLDLDVVQATSSVLCKGVQYGIVRGQFRNADLRSDFFDRKIFDACQNAEHIFAGGSVL